MNQKMNKANSLHIYSNFIVKQINWNITIAIFLEFNIVHFIAVSIKLFGMKLLMDMNKYSSSNQLVVSICYFFLSTILVFSQFTNVRLFHVGEIFF